MMKKAEEKGVKFLLPVDNKAGDKYAPDCHAIEVDSDNIPDGYMGLDIGPKTQEIFADAIKGAGTVVWNGPMGVSEWENFASGTIAAVSYTHLLIPAQLPQLLLQSEKSRPQFRISVVHPVCTRAVEQAFIFNRFVKWVKIIFHNKIRCV